MRTDILERKKEILQWISENLPNAEIARRLKCKVDTLKSYYKKMGITYSGNSSRKGMKHPDGKKPIQEYLNGNSSNSSKRIRLIEEGLKKEECEVCHRTEWIDRPISLELHHKDFDHYNNSLDNLMIVCPNCHAYLHFNNNNYNK